MTFDTNGFLTPGVAHTLFTSQIVVSTGGVYEVTWVVSGAEPNQFALFVNGLPVPGGISGSGAGTQQNAGMVIVNLNAGDGLTLRNHTSFAAVTLQPLAGGTRINSNASLIIKKLQ